MAERFVDFIKAICCLGVGLVLTIGGFFVGSFMVFSKGYLGWLILIICGIIGLYLLFKGRQYARKAGFSMN